MKTIMSAAVIATLAWVCVPSASAQQQFALRGGINLSKFIGDDVESDSRAGLNLGAAWSPLHFGPVSVVLEGYYRQKGAGLQEQLQAGQPPAGDIEVGIDYVEVPVLLRLDVPVGPRWLIPYLQGGPAFGWRIDCGITVEAETGETEENCDDLFGDQLEETLKDYEQGLVLGGGLFFQIPRLGAVNLDARYTRGLSRLSEGDEGPDVKNESFTLMLGYAFGFAGI